MTRIRLSTGPVALFGAMLVIALIVFLPLRLVLGWVDLGSSGLAAREVRGSVWAGAMRDTRFGGLALGDLGAQLSPLQLLVGRARVDLRGSSRDARPLFGAVGISRHSFGIDDVSATVPAGLVFAPLPVSALDLDEISARFQDGVCQKAEGRVKAVLSGDLGGLSIGQSLSGNARCDGDALLLPLASGAGTDSVSIHLWSSGRFRAELTTQPSDPAAISKLVLAGFQPGPRGYMLAIEGKF